MNDPDSRIAVSRSATPPAITIVLRAAGGAAEWIRILVLAAPILCLVLASHAMFRSSGLAVQHPEQHAYGYAATFTVGLLILAVMVLAVVDAVWKLFGCERIVVEPGVLRLVVAVGSLSRTRSFPLETVNNVRWRERRVAAKGGSYERRVVSFDAGSRTLDFGNLLSFSDAHALEREVRAAVEAMRAKGHA